MSAIAGPFTEQSEPPVVTAFTVGSAGVTAAGDATLVSAAVANAGYSEFVMASPTTLSRLPNLTRFYHIDLVDIFGNNLNDGDGLDLDDIIRVYLWAGEDTPPTDVVMWAGISAGVPSATNLGAAVGLEYTATGWRVQHATNIGAGWVVTNGVSVSALTVAAVLQIIIGNLGTQARVAAYPLDAAGVLVGTANVPTVASTAAIGHGHTKFFWGVGWATGSGGDAGAEVSMSARPFLVRANELEGFSRFLA